MRRVAFAGIAFVSALLLALVTILLVPSLSEVTDSGQDVRSYPSDAIYRVQIADSVTVYVDEESWERVPSELAIQAALFALAGVSLLAALILRAVAAPRMHWLFYLVATLGLAWLGLDEAWGLHETIGHNLPFLTSLPGIGKPDDFVFAAYVVPAAVAAWAFRDVLRSEPTAWRLFLAGIAVLALAGIMDVRGLPLDEPLELLLAVLLVAAFGLLLRAHLLTWAIGPARDGRAGALGQQTSS